MAIVRFRDWDIRYNSIKPTDPVRCIIRGKDSTREFVGYIHDIKPDISPGKQFVELTLIGASYKLKQARQRVYYDTTASQVVKQIATENNFSVTNVEDHPRVYPQIVQAGHTDLELMTKLAKQCGYTLRIQNTSVYFEPLTAEYTRGRASSPSFIMRESNDPRGSTMYSFKLLLGESTKYADAYKSNVQIGGVDPSSASVSLVVNADRPEITRETSSVEYFDSFATNITAPGYSATAYEAYAIDQRNRFPYRAQVEVTGTADITPDKSVYLSGLGPEYSGYWIVLSAQHKIIEESQNILKYTTVLQLGTDSLGSARPWLDGKLIDTPSVVQLRELVPGVRNEVVNSSSLLDTTNSVWMSDGKNAGASTAFINNPSKTSYVVSRLEKIGVL
jgi:phage protein D